MREDRGKPWGMISAPPGLGIDGAAMIVKGGSMGGIANNSLVFYDEEVEMPCLDLVGELVVAAVEPSGERYVRFLEQGSQIGLYNLRSATGPTLADVRLRWAALVKWVKLPPHEQKFERPASS
jgi:hypothetical protein